MNKLLKILKQIVKIFITIAPVLLLAAVIVGIFEGFHALDITRKMYFADQIVSRFPQIFRDIFYAALLLTSISIARISAERKTLSEVRKYIDEAAKKEINRLEIINAKQKSIIEDNERLITEQENEIKNLSHKIKKINAVTGV